MSRFQYQGLAEPLVTSTPATVTPVALTTLWDGIRPIPQVALTATTQPISPLPDVQVPTWFLGQQLAPPPLLPRDPGFFAQNVSPLPNPVVLTPLFDAARVGSVPFREWRPESAVVHSLLPITVVTPTFAGASSVDLVPRREWRPDGWYARGLPVSLVRLDVPTQPWPLPVWPTFRPRPETVAPLGRPVVPFDAAQQVATLPQPSRQPPVRWSLLPTLSQPPSIVAQAPPPLSWKPTLRDTPLPLPTRPTSVPYFTFYPVPLTPAAAPALSWQPRFEVPTRARASVANQAVGSISPFPISVPAYLFTMWKAYLPDFARTRTLHPSQLPSGADPGWGDIATVSFATWRPLLPDWIARRLPLPTPASVVVPLPGAVAESVGCIMVGETQVTSSTLLHAAVAASTLLESDCTVSTLGCPEIC